MIRLVSIDADDSHGAVWAVVHCVRIILHGLVAMSNKEMVSTETENKGQRKVFLPNKLLECLPRSAGLPNERLRWNTNEAEERQHHPVQQEEGEVQEDGYCWKKRKDGKTTREDHMKLKCLYGCYVHSSIVPTFHRRCYWLLQNPDIVLVHYLNVPSLEDSGKCSPLLCAEVNIPHRCNSTKHRIISPKLPPSSCRPATSPLRGGGRRGGGGGGELPHLQARSSPASSPCPSSTSASSPPQPHRATITVGNHHSNGFYGDRRGNLTTVALPQNAVIVMATTAAALQEAEQWGRGQVSVLMWAGPEGRRRGRGESVTHPPQPVTALPHTPPSSCSQTRLPLPSLLFLTRPPPSLPPPPPVQAPGVATLSLTLLPSPVIGGLLLTPSSSSSSSLRPSPSSCHLTSLLPRPLLHHLLLLPHHSLLPLTLTPSSTPQTGPDIWRSSSSLLHPLPHPLLLFPSLPSLSGSLPLSHLHPSVVGVPPFRQTGETQPSPLSTSSSSSPPSSTFPPSLSLSLSPTSCVAPPLLPLCLELGALGESEGQKEVREASSAAAAEDDDDDDDDDDEGNAPPSKLALLQDSAAHPTQPANQTQRPADRQQPLRRPYNHLSAPEAPPPAQVSHQPLVLPQQSSVFTGATANTASAPSAVTMATPPVQVKEEGRRGYDSEDTCMDTHLEEEEEAEPSERGGENSTSPSTAKEANPVAAPPLIATAPTPAVFPAGVRYMVPPQPSPSSSFLPFPHPLPPSSTRLASSRTSPQWSYPEVLITGPWSELSGRYSCVFDQSTVPASLIQPGVLRCYCPAHEAGLVCLQVLESGGSVSSSVLFEYRARNASSLPSSQLDWLSLDGQNSSPLLLPPPPPLPSTHSEKQQGAVLSEI
ncbi:hypothetical protein INR49_007377 [Caranx melampygus]|nr:hypothetical protein INR49_007377 [Caranx melampygus]